MLTRFDDYAIHQTPEPVAHPASSDRNVYDRYWFNGYTDDGEFFAVDDTCTHQDASLADGWLEGCEVECPLHASRFDLRTGAVDAPPARRPIRAHAVTVQDDTVYVTMSTEAPNLPPGLAPASP